MEIVKYIKDHGLDKTVNDFNLKIRDYGHKVILKYSQIDSNFEKEVVREARGIILRKDTWEIMSWSFYKFFNVEEGHAAKIDLDNAHILEKCDGTMIQFYYDIVQDEWCVGTTGTAEGEGEVNNKLNTTFKSLFWDTFNKLGGKLDSFVKGNTYVFELMTPYNIVVTPHSESTLKLLSIRNLFMNVEFPFESLELISKQINIPLVKRFKLKVSDFGGLKRTFEGMVWSEEGYVVMDETNSKNHKGGGNSLNRVKAKNPAYVAVHHLKGKTAEHNIVSIVKSNELDEFIATFPERAEEIRKLKISYDKLKHGLNLVWDILKDSLPKNITKGEQKKFAMKVFEVIKTNKIDSKFSGLFFGLKDGKVDSVDEFLFEYDNKVLYKIL